MKRIQPVLLPALLPVLQLFLFGPLTLYAGNRGEFDFSFLELAGTHAWIALAALAVIVAAGAVLPERARLWFVAFLAGLSLLLWIQSSFLVRDYGHFGSDDSRWADFVWAPWIDGAIWIGGMVLSLVFAKRLARLANVICGSLGVLLGIVFLTTWAGLPQKPAGIDQSVAPDEVVRFSRGTNVVHIMFDQLQSEIFQEVISDPGSELAGLMDGFTVFRNTSGSFPATLMSLPVIHSGRVYDNTIPAPQFIDQVYNQESAATPNVLARSGYSVDLAVPFPWQEKFAHRSFLKLPVPYGASMRARVAADAHRLRTLVVFRHAPHSLKRRLVSQAEAPRAAGLSQEPPDAATGTNMKWNYALHFAHRDFMRDLSERMTAQGEKPAYKFIHLLTSHFPTVYNQDGAPAGGALEWNWGTIRTQARVCLGDLVAFIRRAKELGIYDDMLLVVHSDHGYTNVNDSTGVVDLRNWAGRASGYPVLNEEAFASIICAAHPFLAIKPARATGAMKTSNAPVTLGDIPATINALLGIESPFPGRSVFSVSENETRTRVFTHYSRHLNANEEFYPDFTQFEINGPVSDPNSWSLKDNSSGTARRAQLEPLPAGKAVDFGAANQGRHFIAQGLQPASDGHTWTELPVVDFIVKAQAGTRSVELLAFGANTSDQLPAQFVEAEVDGEPAGTWLVNDSQVLRIPVPPVDGGAGAPIRITLRLPDTAAKNIVKPGHPDTRVMGIGLASITASPVDASREAHTPFEADVSRPAGQEGILGRGWGQPSTAGRRWSVGKEATIRWKDDSRRPVRVVRVAFDRVYTGPKGEPQRVRATKAGSTIGEWDLMRPGELIIPLPLGAGGTGRWNELKLLFPDAHSPASRGESEDKRELAIQIYEVSLR